MMQPDGTYAFDDSESEVLHVSRRAATLLTKLLTTHEFAPVRAELEQRLTDHGRAIVRRLVTDLACQVLDVREPGHTCEGCPEPEPEWSTSNGCPPDCDRTYSGSGHLGEWSSDHNGYCKHGTYVAGSGADWMCGYCENGD